MNQTTRISNYLSRSNRPAITPLTALKLFGTMRLASRISEIKSEGMKLEEKWIKTAGGKHVKQFRRAGK